MLPFLGMAKLILATIVATLVTANVAHAQHPQGPGPWCKGPVQGTLNEIMINRWLPNRSFISAFDGRLTSKRNMSCGFAMNVMAATMRRAPLDAFNYFVGHRPGSDGHVMYGYHFKVNAYDPASHRWRPMACGSYTGDRGYAHGDRDPANFRCAYRNSLTTFTWVQYA